METILLIAFVLVALALIGLVLIQHGKGADAGAAFGSGASATVFGSSGSGSFLSRTTGVLATIFFILSLALANISGTASRDRSVTEIAPAAMVEETPASMSDVPSDVPTMSAPVAVEVPAADASSAAPTESDVPAMPAADASIESAPTDSAKPE